MEFSTNCPHSFQLLDADECKECVALEVARQGVIKNLELYLVNQEGLTTAEVAVILTASARLVSRRLRHPSDAKMLSEAMLYSLRQLKGATLKQLVGVFTEEGQEQNLQED